MGRISISQLIIVILLGFLVFGDISKLKSTIKNFIKKK